MGTLGEVLKMIDSWRFYFVSLVPEIVNCILIHNTTRESCIKLTMLDCGADKLFPAKQNDKGECFLCISKARAAIWL